MPPTTAELRQSYTIIQEPRGPAYERLLQCGLDTATFLGFIVQPRRVYPPAALGLLNDLEQHLVEKRLVNEWPGTRLLGSRSEEQRLYSYDSSAVEVVRGHTQRLFEWQNPELPDDLHLLRYDRSTWLASIAHEDDAWLELTSHEYAQLRTEWPDIAALLRPDVAVNRNGP